MKKHNNISIEDIQDYKVNLTLDGLEIWYIYLTCQAALRGKKSRKKLGVNLDIVKRLNSVMETEIKNIDRFCKVVGE